MNRKRKIGTVSTTFVLACAGVLAVPGVAFAADHKSCSTSRRRS